MNFQHTSSAKFYWTAAAAALVSMSLLLFEISLTRIFSVMLSYHFVFAVISFSLFGLGLGGLFLKRWQQLFPNSGMQSQAFLFALFIVLSVLFLVYIPIYANAELARLRIWIYITVITIPFFFAGLTLSAFYHRFPSRCSLLYGLELLGASIGIVIAIKLLGIMSGFNVVMVSAMIAAAGAFVLSFSVKKFAVLKGTLSGGTVLVFLFFSTGNFSAESPIAGDENKDMFRLLNTPDGNARIVETRWSSFGRTDLINDGNDPYKMWLFVDGAAGTPMFRLDSLLNNEERLVRFVVESGEYFPFYFLEDYQKENALIIGPGGGREVILSLIGGVKSVTAVEVNPEIVNLMNDYSDYNGGIYQSLKNVNAVVGEGRNYIRSTHNQYDLIMMSLPVTKSSRSVDGYALTENYLFTVEAMQDYLDHLTPEGRIVIGLHNDAELYRIVALVLTAFKERGVGESDGMKHLYAIASGMMPTLVISNQPFDSTMAAERHSMMHRLGYNYGNIFVPYEQQQTYNPFEELGLETEIFMFDQSLAELSSGELTLNEFIKRFPYDISPVTDDSPFFYNFDPGLPAPFNIFLPIILVITGLVVVPVLIPRRSFPAKILPVKTFKTFLLIFFFLGAGYMVITVALFQKLSLYIPNPIMALSVLLFSVLISSGVGSFVSSLIKKPLSKAIILSSFIIASLTIGYTIFLPSLLSPYAGTLIFPVAVLIPLGFAMGFPFPLLIRLMNIQRLENVVGAMWGVDAVASVVGASLTVIIGIAAGFSYALYLGSVLYMIVMLLTIIPVGYYTPLKDNLKSQEF